MTTTTTMTTTTMTGSVRHSLRRAVAAASRASSLAWEGAIEGAERGGSDADSTRDMADVCEQHYDAAADCLDAIDHETSDSQAWDLVRAAIAHLEDARSLEREGGDDADAAGAIDRLTAACEEAS